MGKLFGTNGVRGIVNEDMNVELAITLGYAIATYFGAGTSIAIGTDTRTSNEMLKSAVISGLVACGTHAVDVGIVPSPSLQYYVKKNKKIAAGVIITASHNPPEFNGIKVIDGDGTELPSAKEDGIEGIYFSKKFKFAAWSEIGNVAKDESANDAYVEAVLRQVDVDAIKKAKLKVLYDGANGAGGLTSPRLLRKLACHVVTTNAQPDGLFPGHNSEPTPDNLKDVLSMVTSVGADIGFVNDGDADRAIFVDEKGQFIYGDKTLALVSQFMVRENHGGVVVTPVSSSSCVEDVVRKEGGSIVYTRVGAPIVARKMIEIKALFGGEENGGLIFPEHQYCRDGAMAAAKIIEIIATTGTPLSELIAQIPSYSLYKTKVACPNNKKESVLRAIADEVKKLGKVDTTDGVKVSLKDGWVLIRPSGTEPIFRIYTESKDGKVSEKRAKEYAAKITALAGAGGD